MIFNEVDFPFLQLSSNTIPSITSYLTPMFVQLPPVNKYHNPTYYTFHPTTIYEPILGYGTSSHTIVQPPISVPEPTTFT